MAPRPTREPGGVTWRENRGLWRARVTLPDGTRRCRHFHTQAEGWAWVQGTLRDADTGRMTVDGNRRTEAFLREWLQDVAPRRLKPTSLYNYTRDIEYALPMIGHVKLKDLNRPRLEALMTALQRGDDREKPLAQATVLQTFRVLKQALDYAEDCGFIPRNPMARMDPPRQPDPRSRVLSVEEVRAILAEAEDSRWRAAIWVLATTGMRISEVLGLEWKNLDLARGLATVEHQTGRIPGKPGVHILDPKTRSSKRTVYLPVVVREVLRFHADRQRIERRAAEDRGDWQDHGLVFCSPVGRPYYRSQLDEAFRRITARLGITGVVPHSFRHTVSTVVQENGLSQKTAQTLLGHATARMTSYYSHPTDAGLRQSAALFDRLLGDDPSDHPLTPVEVPWNTVGDQPRDQTTG